MSEEGNRGVVVLNGMISASCIEKVILSMGEQLQEEVQVRLQPMQKPLGSGVQGIARKLAEEEGTMMLEREQGL